jgi:hypothetical protein
MKRFVMTSLAVLALGVLLVPYAFAANTVDIQVLDDGAPAEDVVVEVIASNESVSGTTDAEGNFTIDIDGNYYRLKVQDTIFAEPFRVEDGPVLVELNNL